MSRWLRAVALCGLGLALLLAVALWLAVRGGGARLPAQRIDIAEGSSLREVAEQLEAAGILDRAWRLRLAARVSGAEPIKAGRYELSPGTPPLEILRILAEGRVLTQPLVVPEGLHLSAIAATAADQLGLDAGRFLELAQAPPAAWRERWDLPEQFGLEGYLLPETYRFAHGIAPELVLQTMLDACFAVLDTLRLPEGFDRHALLTLASIVEAEATRADERAKIAAVYHNRLRRRWRLEADPTVAYALGKQGERLYYRDLQVDSPYNTYRRGGLPPGPINCPGRGSIVAAAYPQSDFDAMYFVADGAGGHVFSRTWAEHRAAVQSYRARRAGAP
jgi:UPF0755 protein